MLRFRWHAGRSQGATCSASRRRHARADWHSPFLAPGSGPRGTGSHGCVCRTACRLIRAIARCADLVDVLHQFVVVQHRGPCFRPWPARDAQCPGTKTLAEGTRMRLARHQPSGQPLVPASQLPGRPAGAAQISIAIAATMPGRRSIASARKVIGRIPGVRIPQGDQRRIDPVEPGFQRMARPRSPLADEKRVDMRCRDHQRSAQRLGSIGRRVVDQNRLKRNAGLRDRPTDKRGFVVTGHDDRPARFAAIGTHHHFLAPPPSDGISIARFFD